jgi:sugar phosphate isomerase/epimerase
MKFAVQLYSLRRDYSTPEEFLAIFKKVKALGFDGVEFAGYNGLEPEVIRAALDEAGLVAVGCHSGVDTFDGEENIAAAIRTAKILGMNAYGTGGAAHGTKEDIDRLRRIYKAANEAGEKEGIKFYYHNHSEEFKLKFDGKLCEDLIGEAAYLQIDTYWSFCAGVDNYKYITENKDRIIGVHIKDGTDRKPKALGEGDCDLGTVIRAAKDIGLEWLVLENDDPEPTGLLDIARSMEYLKANV